MNSITIELCAEDRARIDKVIGLLEQYLAPDIALAPAPVIPVETPKETPKEQTPEPAAPTAPVEPPKEEKPEAPAPTSTATVDDLRKMVITLSSAGRKDEAKAVIKSYADKVSEVPADKIDECLAKLNALGYKV